MSHAPGGSRLEHFPITLMPSVMGLVGLAIAFLKFQHFFQVDLPIGQGILFAATAWFGFLLIMQTVRLMRYPAAVSKDWRHPIRINFFPALSICFLLLAIGYNEIGQVPLARVLWLIGTPLHLTFLLIILYRWFHHPQLLMTLNPAWFIPVVGPILVPVAGVHLFHPEISWFFFATGLVYWIVLLAVFIYRVLFHDPMAPKLLPTLFILIAPASVGFIAYIKLTGSFDPFARVLFYFGVFTFIMLVTMLPEFRKVPFFLSWWGYTFPLDAFTISFFLMYKVSQLVFFKWAALGLLAVTTLVVLNVLVRTVLLAARRGLCVAED
jgi:tellurite resistance protein|nr:SLAC1 anion channel family protein [Candidatus Krumholzibacteria bacterium]